MTATERELRSWEAYLETGSYRDAARRLHVHEDTIRRHVAMLKAEHCVKTTAQLAAVLERAKVA